MKKYIVLALLIASCACAQIMPGIVDSQRNLPGWLSDANFVAPVFNGVNQSAQIASGSSLNLPSGSSGRTLMGWFRNYSLAPQGGIMAGYGTVSTPYGRMFGITPVNYQNKLWAWFYSWGFTQDCPSTFGWHHYAITLPDGGSYGSAALYMDAVLLTGAKTQTGSGYSLSNTVNTVPSALAIGGYAASFGNDSASELAIFNRALSPAEIQFYYPKRLSGKEPGIVALYHMNDGVNVATQTLIDSVGRKHATMYNSVPWTVRRGYGANASDVRSAQYALSFDGSNDYATMPTTVSFAGLASGSACCWYFEPGGALSASKNIFQQTNAAFVGKFGISLFTNHTLQGYMRDNDGAGVKSASNTAPLATGTWNFISVTVDSNTDIIALYVNSTQVSTYSYPLGAFSESPVGYNNLMFNTAEYLKGGLCNLTFWNRALTQAEISSLMYSSVSGSEPGLIYGLKLSEGSGVAAGGVGLITASSTLINSPTWIGRSIP